MVRLSWKDIAAIAAGVAMAWFAFVVLPGPQLTASEWAAWVQAVGSVAAIGAALHVAGRQARLAERVEYDRRVSFRIGATYVAEQVLGALEHAQKVFFTEGPVTRSYALRAPAWNTLIAAETALLAYPLTEAPNERFLGALITSRLSIRNAIGRLDSFGDTDLPYFREDFSGEIHVARKAVRALSEFQT